MPPGAGEGPGRVAFDTPASRAQEDLGDLPAPAEALRQWVLTGDAPRPGSADAVDRIVAAACEQRVAGSLYLALGRDEAAWPAAACERLRVAHHTSFARGLEQLRLARHVLAVLEKAGIRALPMKGVALAEPIYGSVAERPMGDVDLLVIDDWPRAVEMLRAAGFRDGLRGDHAWTFLEPDTGIPLELHHSVTSCPGLFPFDGPGAWSRSLPADGLITRRPSTEDLLLQLALHASFQSGLVLSLGQYLDFRRLLEREAPDPERLWEIAARARALPALAAGLAAAGVVVGADVGDPLASRLFACLPPGFLAFFDRRLRSRPLSMLDPAPRPIGRVRWELLAGRRSSLIYTTIDPRLPGDLLRSWRRALRVAGRAARLVTRWVPLTLFG